MTRIFALVMFVLFASVASANHLPESTPESLVWIGELPLVDIFPCVSREGAEGVCFVHQGLDAQYLVVLRDAETLHEIWVKNETGLSRLYPVAIPRMAF